MMRDCSDGEMRDQLPLWIHGSLAAEAAARVASHVAGCADCAAEAALLRVIRDGFPVPSVDVARIVAAVPSAADARRRSARTSRWRMASAASFLLVASVSLATLRATFRGAPTAPTESGVASSAPVVAEPAMPAVVAYEAVTVTVDAPVRETVPGFAAVSQLSDAQLRTLLDDLQRIEALPSAEPQPGHHSVTHDTTEDDS